MKSKLGKAVAATIIILLGLAALGWAQGGAGEGRGGGQGLGAGQCVGCKGGSACTLEFTAPMDDPELIGPKLDTALDDEYRAQAMYGAVTAEFGELRPFTNIVKAEGHHAELLLRVYDKYDIEAPANSHTGDTFEFSSAQEAGQVALDAEIGNAELYDDLLKGVRDTDVISVFEQLQWASRERHLPALRRFVEGGGNGGGQTGNRWRHRRGQRQ